MTVAPSLVPIAREIREAFGLGRTLDELLASRSTTIELLALGEPTHGIAAFPLLRNTFLAALVDRGYRSVALETDAFAAAIVDDFVNGGQGELDEVMASAFSHGFGNVPGNRELVKWLRAFNADLDRPDRIRFYGFDGPVEFSGAPGPAKSLLFVRSYLPGGLQPESARDLEGLVGDEADWTNPAAMYDPAASVGDSAGARGLRIVANDLASALRIASPLLQPADPDGYSCAVAHSRTAVALLRYHAAMATPGEDRLASLLGIRAEMMADNLLAIRGRERDRGPTLVFAHNAHLQRTVGSVAAGDTRSDWANAGTLVERELGEAFLFVAADANPATEPDTLQGLLAAATTRRALFPSAELQAALPEGVRSGDPILPGHIPVKTGDLAGADAVVFIADTDGTRHQYW